MFDTTKPIALTLTLLASSPALAASGGQIGSLPMGYYVCELTGDATGPAGLRQDHESFTIINASSYKTDHGRGTYLLTGDILQMTRGPKHGERFHVISANFLRLIGPDGADGDLRCIRQVANNR